MHPRFKVWKREMDEKFEAEHGSLNFSNNYDIYMVIRKLGRRHTLTFRHRASCILGQAFHYSPENAFYIFNQQIYFII